MTGTFFPGLVSLSSLVGWLVTLLDVRDHSVRAPSPVVKGLSAVILLYALLKAPDLKHSWHRLMWFTPFWELGAVILTLRKRNELLKNGMHDVANKLGGAAFWLQKLAPLAVARLGILFLLHLVQVGVGISVGD